MNDLAAISGEAVTAAALRRFRLTVVLSLMVLKTGAANGQTELLVDPLRSLGAETSAPYVWTTIPLQNVKQRYQTGAFVFTESGVLDLSPDASYGSCTHLEFRVCLLPSKAHAVPSRGSEPPTWKSLRGAGDHGRAAVGVMVYDSHAGTAELVHREEFTEFLAERRILVPLPKGFTGGRHSVAIDLQLGEDTQALVYRVCPFQWKEEPRRVLLVSLDTHALRHMSLVDEQDFDTSPFLRELVNKDEHAVLFSGAMAVSNWTLPTHATVFTGLYPTQHQLINSKRAVAFSNELETLPELLQSRQVETFWLASHTRVGWQYGYNRGVDHYKDYDQPFGRRGRRLLADALQLLATTKGRDVFMFLHLFDAHVPYTNFPENYKSLCTHVRPHYPRSLYYGDLYTEKIYGSGGWDPRRRIENIKKYGETFGKQMPGARAAYQLGIRDVDDMVREFFAELKRRNALADSTVLFFGDHGEEFFTHGLLTHTSLYDENLNVPFIMKLAASSPEAAAIRGRTSPVPYYFEAHTTLFRVMLDLFGVEAPSYLARAQTNALSLGELASLAENQRVFAEFYVAPTSPYYEASLISRDGRKIILSTTLGDRYGWQVKDEYAQIYDLNADRGNSKNLYSAKSEKDQDLRRQAIRKAVEIRKLQFKPAREHDLSSEELKKLRDLGYIN